MEFLLAFVVLRVLVPLGVLLIVRKLATMHLSRYCDLKESVCYVIINSIFYVCLTLFIFTVINDVTKAALGW